MKTATVRETERTTRVTEIEFGEAQPPKSKGLGKSVPPKGKARAKETAPASGIVKYLTQYYCKMYRWMRKRLTFTLEFVTPEMAEKYLATTRKNRKSVQAVIQQFVKSILAKGWGINPQPVIFDSDGCLIDGGHRLAAIVKSGIAVPMLIVRGVPPESFDVIDDGPRRSLKQVMAMDGVPMYETIASIVRTVIVYERAQYTTIQFASGVNNREGLEFYYANEERVAIAAAWGAKVKAGGHGTAAGGGFVAYVLLAISPAKAAEFLDGIATGANLPVNSPILKYRNKYAVLRAQGSVHRNTQVDMIFEAWNEWNDHKTERVRMVIPYGLDLASPTVTCDPLAKF